MQKKHLVLLLAIVSSFILVNAQEYKFGHITTVDGLSHNEVRKIVKDSTGFLWFGTQNGLNRYDGYHFKVFKNIPDDSTTIIGDKIYSLVASKDKLWVGTVTGLSVLNTNTLKVIPAQSILNTIGKKLIMHIFYDGINTVWVSTENNNYRINSTTFEIEEVLSDYKIACISQGINGVFWIGTNKGLLQHNCENNTIIKAYDIGNFNGYSLDQIYTNSYGEVWLTLGNSIYRYQSERDRFVKEYTSESLNSIAEDKNGSVFFGSYGKGLLRYVRDSGLFKPILADPEDHLSLSSNDVYDIIIDNEDIVWVGTQEGLDFYDFSRNKFQNIVHLPKNENSLRSSFVQTLFMDSEKKLWVGTREGIDQVDFSEGYLYPKVSHFRIKEESFEVLNDAYISNIYEDSKNRVWIATMDNGLFLHKRNTNFFKHYINDENTGSIASNSIRSIMEDHQGRLWFGTGRGLSLLKEGNNGNYTFENFGYAEYDTDSFVLNDVYTVFQDSKKRIWIGMNGGGLSLLQEKGNNISFLRFNNVPSDNRSLSHNDVFVVYEDSGQRVWFGTSGGGLNLLMEDGGQASNGGYYFKHYLEKDGLSDNEINAISEDGSGSLWIATNKGLSKFNPDEEIFTNHTTYDGVLKGKFRKNARWKTEDGTLFFGGTAGINFFNPDDFRINKVVPNPVFTRLSIDGNEIKIGQKLGSCTVFAHPLDSGGQITLPAKDNRFDIEFSALSYASPNRNKYAYTLEGFDTEWKIISGKNPHASYSKLSSGSYRLYMKASNNDGVWNQKPIHLDITVKGSFFNGKAFKAMAIILFLSTIVLGILLYKKYKNNRRLRSLKSKVKKSLKPIDKETEKELLQEVKALNSLMEKEQLYLNSELGLNQLAEKLNVSANHLSMLLNDYIGKNFYDYVNHFRVEEVKKRLADPSYKKQTLSSIGGDCGFNSKSAFNRIFKNLTGKTPSQYQKELD